MQKYSINLTFKGKYPIPLKPFFSLSRENCMSLNLFATGRGCLYTLSATLESFDHMTQKTAVEKMLQERVFFKDFYSSKLLDIFRLATQCKAILTISTHPAYHREC